MNKNFYCYFYVIFLKYIISEKVNDIVVTWSTFNDTEESRVQYGVGIMDTEATGSSKLFIDGGKLMRSQYIHTVTLKDLKFNTRYGKHCAFLSTN